MDVDWKLAARIARSTAGQAPASVAPAILQERADAARDQVVAATGLVPAGALPTVEWVDRGAWIDANLRTMRSTLGPVLDRAPSTGGPAALQAAVSAVVAAEVGGMVGMFARRVLGQYELDLLDASVAPRLMLVGPNLDRAATELKADRDELVTWVTLHEVTHAVQFGSVPWLRERLGGTLRELLSALDVRPDPRALLRLGVDDLKAWAGSVREGGLLGAVMGSERRLLLDRVQGTMGLVEGHAEWTMDHAGAGVLDDVEGLRAAMDRRREDRPPLLRILDRLLGIDLKMRQYAEGRVFCDAVVEARGTDGLRDAWAAPELAPSKAELAAPAEWLRRTAPAA
ncbi:coenzyme F420 biosynthesis-associated protein [Baekduia soli]|uniref:Coenzyme F420 biosynthesis-associated protein n=1 Tax=Baekduia soli TaxID=496014 RepID=A0A5B8U0U6_9ACTN|nr:zinc-dependent metalloprotease [Baekduia soli]QEC46606.1 coenzyme F420 biosynthesis-associated protein [Baekduia soli]